MRANEFILEVTNPSGPPPARGSSEFTKSQQYYNSIVDRVVNLYNQELNTLSRTNPTEFTNKTADENAMRDELRDEIVNEVLKRGGQNFIKRDIDKLKRAFNLQDTNTTIDPTTKNISVNDSIKNSLTDTATDTFYQNRYIRFNDQALWARLSGGKAAVQKYTSGVAIPQLTSGAANGIKSLLGIDVDEPSFWKTIKSALNNNVQKEGLYKILSSEYPSATKPSSGTVNVKSMEREAGLQLYNTLGINVGNPLFWPRFTDGINDTRTFTLIKSIFDKNY